jgi:hypothetical protein
LQPGQKTPITECIATNQRLPSAPGISEWPTANFTFDIVGKTLSQPPIELRVPVNILVTPCSTNDRVMLNMKVRP